MNKAIELLDEAGALPITDGNFEKADAVVADAVREGSISAYDVISAVEEDLRANSPRGLGRLLAKCATKHELNDFSRYDNRKAYTALVAGMTKAAYAAAHGAGVDAIGEACDRARAVAEKIATEPPVERIEKDERGKAPFDNVEDTLEGMRSSLAAILPVNGTVDYKTATDALEEIGFECEYDSEYEAIYADGEDFGFLVEALNSGPDEKEWSTDVIIARLEKAYRAA